MVKSTSCRFALSWDEPIVEELVALVGDGREWPVARSNLFTLSLATYVERALQRP